MLTKVLLPGKPEDATGPHGGVIDASGTGGQWWGDKYGFQTQYWRTRNTETGAEEWYDTVSTYPCQIKGCAYAASRAGNGQVCNEHAAQFSHVHEGPHGLKGRHFHYWRDMGPTISVANFDEPHAHYGTEYAGSFALYADFVEPVYEAGTGRVRPTPLCPHGLARYGRLGCAQCRGWLAEAPDSDFDAEARRRGYVRAER